MTLPLVILMIALASMPPLPERQEPSQPTEDIVVDYIAPPRTIGEQWDKVQLVVLGDVISTSARIIDTQQSGPTRGAPAQTRTRPVTDNDVRIAEVFKNTGPALTSDLIRLTSRTGTFQVGSRIIKYENAAVPIFNVGERAIFFLYWSPVFQGYEVAGVAGSMKVRGNRVALEKVPNLDITRGRSSAPLDELLDQLRQFKLTRVPRR